MRSLLEVAAPGDRMLQTNALDMTRSLKKSGARMAVSRLARHVLPADSHWRWQFMQGPPGSGKNVPARCTPTSLRSVTTDVMLEVSRFTQFKRL